MNFKQTIPAALFVAMLGLPLASLAQSYPDSGGRMGGISLPGKPGISDSDLYEDGVRAINDGQWAKAIEDFTLVAKQHGGHADGALYWKAYAENKQGLPSAALDSCTQLQRDYPSSQWIEECGALEIEIRANRGQPVQPATERDENLKLLALNELMRQDEVRAIQVIRELLLSGNSENMSEKAIFILAHGKSDQAQKLLGQIASGQLDPLHQNPALQSKALALLRDRNVKAEVASQPAGAGSNDPITLDVVVTSKSGLPVGDLNPEEFTLLDNKQPRSLVSVQAASGMAAQADPPVEVILLIDAINTSFERIASERQSLESYLARNGNTLELPTSLVLLTEQGIKGQEHPTRNGKVLMDYLEANWTGLRAIHRTQGVEGELEREELSLKALDYLAEQTSRRPGRKLLLWMSPGWYLTTNALIDRVPITYQNIFTNIVTLSTSLRAARITLYSIEPGGTSGVTDYYRLYLKGVDSPKHSDYDDLFLQVLATQSGGKVVPGSNDVAVQIDQCLSDAKAYYVLTFKPLPAAHPNELHEIKVAVDRPGLTARTRYSYYAQP